MIQIKNENINKKKCQCCKNNNFFYFMRNNNQIIYILHTSTGVQKTHGYRTLIIGCFSTLLYVMSFSVTAQMKQYQSFHLPNKKKSERTNLKLVL